MSTMLGRECRVTVDTLDVSGLHVEFKILRTIKHEPNKAAVVVWNLGDDHRAQLLKRNRPDNGNKKLVGIPVRIEAGYKDESQLLLGADLLEIGSVYDGRNWKTTIAGSDGGRSYREGRINTQFTAGTPIANVLRQCCDAMGIGLGNVSNFLAGASFSGGATLPHTLVASGPAARELDRVVRSIGLTWSVQNGALQLLSKGKPLDLGAIELSPTSGLVGSPESSIDASVSLGNPRQFAAGAKSKKAKQVKPKDPSIVKFKTLLIPGITPGRKVVLHSAEFNGNYAVTEVEYVGTTFGQDWYCNCVARAY